MTLAIPLQDIRQRDEPLKARCAYAAIAAIIASYSIFPIFPISWIERLGVEDGFFENLTVLAFLAASGMLFVIFRRTKNYWFIILSVLLFVGAGEEISWGQRIIGFDTPDVLVDKNVQGELTLHNLEVFNSTNFDGTRKEGAEKLLTVNFMFKIFCMVVGIILPLAVLIFRPIAEICAKIRLPIPPLIVGVAFLLNWLSFKGMELFVLLPGQSPQYYDTNGEIMESLAAWVFAVLSFYFLKAHHEDQSTVRN